MSDQEAFNQPLHQRRLGLLQCPNSASLGWSQHSSSENDDNVVRENFCSLPTQNTDGGSEETKSNLNESVPGENPFGSTEENNAVEKSSKMSSSTQARQPRPVVGDEKPANPNTSSISRVAEGSGAPSPRKRARIVEPLTSVSMLLTKDASEKIDHTGQNRSEIKSIAASEAHSTLPQTEMKKETNQPCVTVSLDYETSCPWSTSPETPSDGSKPKTNKRRVQILTITYHGRSEVCKPGLSTVVGTISGKSKLEILPLKAQNNELQESSAANISLDVFGYRIPRRVNTNETDSGHHDNSIIIDRPSWMNSLPLTIICHGDSENEFGSETSLKVRIHSLGNDNNEVNPPDDVGDYYSAYPEESYSIRLLQPCAMKSENYTAAGGGVSTILGQWKNTADKFIDAMQLIGKEGSLPFHSQEEEDDVVNSMQQSAESMINQNRILICGAKNVGKSTFLRYIINRILSEPIPLTSTKQPSEVAIIDLDSGQPELSPPGMLTLTVLKRPLLSDPPMNMVVGGRSTHSDDEVFHHETAYFFGDVTSKSDPDAFIQMASQLMQQYETLRAAKKAPIPLVVNTDGWVKGFGFEILSAIIGAINPGHIVQILGSTKAKTFDMSSHVVVPSECIGGNRKGIQQRHVHVIESYDEGNIAEYDDGNKSRRMSETSGYAESATGTLLATASDHRTHRLCAYFVGGYEKMTKLHARSNSENDPVSFHKEKGLIDAHSVIGLTLASMLPYAVPFHSVRLFAPSGLLDSTFKMGGAWDAAGPLASNDVLDSLNGAIVGLCCNQFSPENSHAELNSGFGAPILPCVGLGIIRSIDYIRGIFYILTPVYSKLLERVTCLVGGNIGLPLECVFRGTKADSFPYLACSHATTNPGIGADKMKSRNHSGRQSR